MKIKTIHTYQTRIYVPARLDYSNSLLYGITVKDMKKLQTIQNRSARLIFKANPREHTSPFITTVALASGL